jgi:TolB-like protein
MNSRENSFLEVIRNRKAILLLGAFIFFGSVRSTSAQGNDLQTAAIKIDKLIAKAKRTKVIVTDFIGPGSAVTEYGQAIAEDLSTDLAVESANLIVIPRKGESFTFGPASFSQDFREGSAALFLAHSVGAEVVVTGNFDKHSDRVDLYLRVWDASSELKMPVESLGGFTVRLSITPEQKAQIGRAIPLDSPNGFRLTAGKKPAALAGFSSLRLLPASGEFGKERGRPSPHDKRRRPRYKRKAAFCVESKDRRQSGAGSHEMAISSRRWTGWQTNRVPGSNSVSSRHIELARDASLNRSRSPIAANDSQHHAKLKYARSSI